MALPADGDTALIGATGDTKSLGAAWVFTRSSSSSSQQGKKLRGGEETGEIARGADFLVVVRAADRE